MARIPDQDLINIRNTFGIQNPYLLRDYNDYTMDAPVEEIDDGIASINTGLPIYTQEGDGNNFLQYDGMDGAPGYIRPTKNATISRPVDTNNLGIKVASLNPVKNLNSYLDLEAYNEALSKAGIPENEMFIEDRPIKEAKQLGILESLKNKVSNVGASIKDFLPGGKFSLTGIAASLLPEQDSRGNFLRDYYGGQDGSNIKNGTIQSGLMAGYNPVSGGFLNTISGGRFGQPTTYGLQNAYDRRIKAIQNTIQKKYLDKGRSLDDTKLDERLAKLREEKRKEAEALLQSQLASAQREIASQGYKDYGQGAASQATQRSYEAPDGSYGGASTQDYGGGE